MDHVYTYIILLFIFIMAGIRMGAAEIYYNQNDDINNVVFTYSNIIAKEGMLNELILDDLTKELDKYGDYDLIIGVKDYTTGNTLVNADLIGLDLRRGGYDKVTVSVLYNSQSVYEWLMNHTDFGVVLNNHKYELGGSKTAFIN